jgi:tetratricopeptide (TPR) repeat protein
MVKSKKNSVGSKNDANSNRTSSHPESTESMTYKEPQSQQQQAMEEVSKVDQFNDLMVKMNKAREQWIEEDDEDPNDPDNLLNHAINLALEQGRGWSPGEKEAYLEKILADDYIPPIFANSVEEVQESGLQEAFTTLIYDDESPTSLMLQFRKKGNDCFVNGKRNEVKNMCYYRDAINHWYEAFAWAEKIIPMQLGDLAQADTDDPTYTERELRELKSTICSNIALSHLMLSNWGYVRNESKKAISFDDQNVKAWYRLAKAYQMLKDYEEAGNAIDKGVAIPGQEQNKDLLKLQTLLGDKVRKARLQRQQRERARAERVYKVKAVWKHCQQQNILLGRVPLVANVKDDEDVDDLGEDEQQLESRWHHHLPHSGLLPSSSDKIDNNEIWSWPCMFVYPSHNQSDFIQHFGENEMIAIRLAEVFPELDDDQYETSMQWDYNNEFVCSQLAIYFEVHESAVEASKNIKTTTNPSKRCNDVVVHPESVELLYDQASCMRFYESTRALKGDEGAEIENVVRLMERKHLLKQRTLWKKKHGSLWAKPDLCPIVRVHPAMTLSDVLTDPRMVVPNVSVVSI